jgi:hypothetical protein
MLSKLPHNPGLRGLLVFVILSLALYAFIVGAIGGRRADTGVAHTARTIEMAFNWTHCGQFSAMRNEGTGIAELFDRSPNPVEMSLAKLATRSHPSVEVYCDGEFSPIQNEDSGLFYLMSAVLFVTPNASALGIFWSLSILMALCLTAFLMLLWRITKDPYVVATAILMSGGLYAIMAVAEFLSTRTFMFPVFMLFITLLIRSRIATSYRALALWSMAAGAIATAGINIRSSYVIHYFAVFALVIAVDSVQQLRRSEIEKSRIIQKALGGTLAFIFGWYLIQTIFIGALDNLDVESGLTHHPFAHPLVLGVAVPKSSFSDSKGIFWRDPIGAILAERVDPLANTNYERYESALFKYYRGLWADHPGEMLGVYARKFHVAGQFEMSIYRKMIIGYVSPGTWFNSGYLLVPFMALTTLLYVLKRRRKNPIITILMTAIIGGILIDFAQAVVIFPDASLNYSVLIFGIAFTTALFWSMIFDQLGITKRLAHRLRR